MRKTCVKLKVSDDGRILLPKGLREGLGILPGQVFEVTYNSNTEAIELKKAVDRCAICGSSKELSKIDENITICIQCKNKIKEA